MTKQRIEKYCKLQREIAMIEERLRSVENNGTEYLTDVVKGSYKGLPYTQHSIVINGYGSRHIPRLRARMTEKMAECEAVENYIDSVEDSLTWQLLTRRYIEGRTLKETAEMVGYSQNHAWRLISDYFKKMINNDDECC